MKNGVIIGIFILLIACLCCIGALAVGGLGYIIYNTAEDVMDSVTLVPGFHHDASGVSTATPVVIRPEHQDLQQKTAIPVPTQSNVQQEPTAVVSATTIPTPSSPLNPVGVSTDTLQNLQSVIIPENDHYILAQRYDGLQGLSTTLEPPTPWYQVGQHERFWVTNVDTNENILIDATLQYVTEHAYFWIEDNIDFDEQELQELAETFEYQIYPTDRAFFGSEWTPGIDGDPHIYILYAAGLGDNLAGYFSSADVVHPLVQDYSNGHEMFLFNSDNVDLDETFTYGVLAHEFQHMIHWYQDRNESTWLNEGFSELAVLLNGYYVGGFDAEFATDPDLQLNDWPIDSDTSVYHYGASFLFVTYFLDRFGDEATRALVRVQENGLDSVDQVLADLGTDDPQVSETNSADDLFLDWAIANYIQDSKVGDGRYTYHNYQHPPSFNPTESFSNCPVNMQTRSINQYGTDYIRITCKGNHTLSWKGSILANVIDTKPHSGSYFLWSNKGDESEMSLTQTFDFTEVSGPLSLNYWTWYDIEEDYDYLYLAASVDGENWQILTTPSGTPLDPSGNSYGWGYNGHSGVGHSSRWIEETIDISHYAGQVVQLRFDYVTDAAVNGEGFLLDDISIPEIGYYSDFEGDAGGWEMDGWVRIDNILPQAYRLAVIRIGDTTTVDYINLRDDVSTEITLDIDSGTEEIILVVTATTRYTRQPAAYTFEIK